MYQDVDVFIEYTNWRGERGWRKIHPASLRYGDSHWHKERQWLLTAFDHGKESMREFAMRDIHTWVPAEHWRDHVRKPKDVLLEQIRFCIETLEKADKPKPYDLYYAVKNDDALGWSYHVAYIGINEIRLIEELLRAGSFQNRVQPWMMECFGEEISADKIERNHRFLEEALELVQANGCTKDEAHQLVEYVYNRPQGDINQEVGGVMVTLAALCLANGIDMHAQAENELERIWRMVEQIRKKQASKPKHSPLPQ